jgi:hypothetical protein
MHRIERMFGSRRRSGSSPPAPRSSWAAAVVLALALPDCGGGSRVTTPPQPTTTPPPPVTLAPTPTTLADLSAGLSSPQANGSINCKDEVRARVTLTNRGATEVTVTGLLDTTGIPAGDCFGGGDRTFRFPTPRTVLPNGTTVLLDQSIYNGLAFCCGGGGGCAGACTFQEAFAVITNLGSVPAGNFNYKVFFQNCPTCPTSTSASSGSCAGRSAVAATIEP